MRNTFRTALMAATAAALVMAPGARAAAPHKIAKIGLMVQEMSIRQLDGREADCFARLDSGAFDLELCSGTAEGVGSSTWGIKHFRSTADGFELLSSGNNAISGFYGPFFTPENGLINPPKHTKVTVEVVERGPVMHQYRMLGDIPDGLLPELRGKGFSTDWIFTAGTPFFQRRHRVDDFSTVINGRSVTNKITVGDKLEGGPGELVFDRFTAYGGTRCRAGDPYAGELVAMVADTVAHSAAEGGKFAEFRDKLADMEAAHGDLYGRLFCSWEGALSEAEIRERLGRVRASSPGRPRRRSSTLPERAAPWSGGPRRPRARSSSFSAGSRAG